MVFEISDKLLDSISADALVLFAFQDKKNFVLTKEGEQLDKKLSGLITKTLEFEQFKGGVGDVASVQLSQDALARKIIVLGLGKKEEFTSKDLRKALALFTKSAKQKISSFVVEKITGDDKDAKKILSELSGKTHHLVTGFTIIDTKSGKKYTASDQSDVTFKKLTEKEIDWYVATGEPMGKAGAYASQEKGMAIVEKIDGNLSTVIGLPAHLVVQALKDFGIDITEKI